MQEPGLSSERLGPDLVRQILLFGETSRSLISEPCNISCRLPVGFFETQVEGRLIVQKHSAGSLLHLLPTIIASSQLVESQIGENFACQVTSVYGKAIEIMSFELTFDAELSIFLEKKFDSCLKQERKRVSTI